MNATSQKKTAPSLGEVTGAAALVIGLISAWLYVAGWTYANHYFDRFGIPLLMVDIPKEHYLVYGGIVVSQFPIWELAIVVIFIAAIALWRWLRLDAGRLKTPLSVLALLAVFWLGHGAAVVAADRQHIQQRESDYGAFPRVQVWLKESAKPPDGSPRTSADLTNGCYRLLLHNQNRLFLLRPLKGALAADLPVLISPWDRIELIRVLPEYTSCG
jgi:MFS family permease